MTNILGLLGRVAIVLAGLAVLLLTTAVAAGLAVALMLRGAWARWRAAPPAHAPHPRVPRRASVTQGIGAREAVVDVIPRER
jgi:hypothetical protein